MTAVTLGPVPVVSDRILSEREREANLWWLAREWGWLGPEREQLLADWAHDSLTAEQRTRDMALYAEYLEKADALTAGEPWSAVMGEDAGFQAQDQALEWALDHAAEALYALMHGER